MPNTVILGFSQVFGEEEVRPIETYFSGISRKTLLKVGALLIYFNTIEANNGKTDNEEVLGRWFGNHNSKERNRLYNLILEIEKNIETKIHIITTQGSLSFFEYVFDHITEEVDLKAEAQLELDLFKGYLLINQKIVNEADETAIHTTNNLSGFSKVTAMSICRSLGYWDTLNYDIREILLAQFAKLSHFIDFSSTSLKLSYLCNKFLENLECDSWKKFLIKYLPVILFELSKGDKTITSIEVPVNEDYEENKRFLENYMLQDKNPIADVDFRLIRNSPLFKEDEGKYTIIYNLFLIEKLYKSLMFNLRSLNLTLENDKKIPELNSFICQNFSENYLFYNEIQSIFRNTTILKTGSEIKATGVTAEPDLYIRNNNNIVLFESKDIQIESTVKMSSDYGIISDALKSKLYFDTKANGNIKPKAVKQLVLNLNRVLDKTFQFDSDYDTKDLKIYTVIVVYERLFEVPGLNRLLISWFKDELLANGLALNQTIRPVILINFDLFIFYKPIIENNIDLFCATIEEYFIEIDKNEIEPLERLQSFNHYFRNKFRAKYSDIATHAGNRIMEISKMQIGEL
ncbi:hypothetical protein IC229_30215 [Spirosoma sp. BT702]|uniref:Uncharacterized protein n=1 Tax=Spirosoma profusum TaxID=2771354 RepID=A0A927AV18_9BACT|nr:hypothetical protein [Spirosoma profusum]MBD2704945.1 hypothetical protein [Spirosoma profusum]